MAPHKKEVVFEVPHRISGFFEIVDELDGIKIENPEIIGSRGAGFNLSAVGRTKIQVEKSNTPEINIFINNLRVDREAETTHYIYNYVKKFVKKVVKINIYHNFDLPVGCGYGASGAGALGTIYGLDHVLNLKLSNIEKGKLAHIAEVVNHTGLGTVCGQLRGGLCILREPGYPCISERINFPRNLKVICGTFGMIHTKSVLTHPKLNLMIKKAGRRAQKMLIQNPNIVTFIHASIEFVKETEILHILNLSELEDLIDNLNNLDILGASMNQLGKSIYSICKLEAVKKVEEVFDSYKPKIQVFDLSINKAGPRMINKKNLSLHHS